MIRPATRRELLCRAATGFGGLAVAFLGHTQAATSRALNPLAVQPTHFQPRAKSVIFLYMDGGPSQLDTFDPKPRLKLEHGKPIQIRTPPTQFNDNGNVMQSPWEFRQHGQSGIWVSGLLPHIATCVDDIAVIRSMIADNSEHTAANYMLHTGFSVQGRPSMGAWITYGIGSESENLPGFVVLDSGLIPAGGMDNFGPGFLPAAYQGTLFRRGSKPIANVEPRESSPDLQREKLGLLKKLNRGVLDRLGSVTELEAALTNYELAYRMQSAVPELIDLSGESKATLDLYGIGEKDTEEFGRQCLLARRLVERGVRFVECLTPKRQGADRWDQHSRLFEGHTTNARATDKPVAALLKDLKSRGLLDQTLVVWGAEFGRTPMSQGTNGRDHNPFGFTMWLAGGGVKGGTVYGATDDYGYFAVENKVHIHDLHATILHLLGLDHKQLTFRFSGRDMRLTDVHGEVVKGILA
jgi:hypothetical protein